MGYVRVQIAQAFALGHAVLILTGCNQAPFQQASPTSGKSDNSDKSASPGRIIPVSVSPIDKSIAGPRGHSKFQSMASDGTNDGYYCNDLVYDENDYIDACDDGGGVYNLENCSCYDGPIEGPIGGGGGGGGLGPILDQTPIITGIAPDVWPSGGVTQVTITGEYFGSNLPNLILSPTISPNSSISYSIAPGGYSDTQIVAQIGVASGTPNEDVAVSVVNNGYGSSFYSGGGVNSPDSVPAYASVLSNMTTNQIAIIGWIDGNAPDILATLNAGTTTPALLNSLNGGPFACNSLALS